MFFWVFWGILDILGILAYRLCFWVFSGFLGFCVLVLTSTFAGWFCNLDCSGLGCGFSGVDLVVLLSI